MRPWSMSQRCALDRLLALSIVLILAASCAGPPFKGYAGPERPDDRIANLDLGGRHPAEAREIGGQKPDRSGLFVNSQLPRREARLLPGKHTIVYGAYPPARAAEGSRLVDLRLPPIMFVSGDNIPGEIVIDAVLELDGKVDRETLVRAMPDLRDECINELKGVLEAEAAPLSLAVRQSMKRAIKVAINRKMGPGAVRSVSIRSASVNTERRIAPAQIRRDSIHAVRPSISSAIGAVQQRSR